MRSGCIEPRFLDHGTSWWVVSFTPRPPYTWEKSPRYPLYRRLGGPQSRSEQCGEEKILDPIGTRARTPLSPSLSTEYITFHMMLYYRAHVNTVESRFKVFPQLVLIFWSPGKSPTYVMHRLSCFSVSQFRVILTIRGQQFSPYMKSVS
jgi:hypothetical protein